MLKIIHQEIVTCQCFHIHRLNIHLSRAKYFHIQLHIHLKTQIILLRQPIDSSFLLDIVDNADRIFGKVCGS